jgi:serine/threonine-protein kinase
VALKILRAPDEERPTGASTTAPESGPQRLLREARAAATLVHPNVAAIFDVGDVDGVPYIAMELVEGRSLRSYIGDPSVPIERRVRWLADVARALGAAHERGLVHRDVKPENVMVRADGVAKVLDFGIARKVTLGSQELAEPTQPTGAGTLMGTPFYMAPEQLRGDPCDGRADEFSWGVVAYELLSGAAPWTSGLSALHLVSEILTRDVPSLIPSCPGLPAAVDATVRKALGKSPRDRFDSMDDVVTALEPHVAVSQRDVTAVESTLPPPAPPSRSGRRDSLDASGARTPSVPPAMPARRRLSARALTMGLVLAAAGALSLYAWRASSQGVDGRPSGGTSSSGVGAAAASSSTPAAVAPFAITDAPPPKSASPEALAAYVAGLQSLRDASIASGLASLEQAVSSDPSLAPARVRLAWFYATQGQLPDARSHFQHARELRATLAERDRALLDGAEPMVVPDVPDVAEAERRMASAVLRAPGDAELAFVLGRDRQLLGRRGAAKEALDLALRDDARFALVYWARGIDAEDAGDVDGALDAYEHCIATAAAAASCLRSRSIHFAQRGQCDRLEADARTMIGVEPDGPRSYEFLARALAARGRPEQAVREALSQRWALYPADRRRARQAGDEAALALARGDFVGAEARARELEGALAGAKSELDHVEPVRLLLDVYAETGDGAAAAKVADDFRARRLAWVPKTGMGDAALDGSLVRVLAASRRGGRLDDASFTRARTDWLAAARATLPPQWTRELWVPAYALPAETKAEAEEAARALPDFLPLPPPRDLTMVDGAAGRVLSLAGHVDDALPYLERAVATCLVFDDPVGHTRAWAALARVREAKGDTAGACDAWRVVAARWATARPRSVSANAARARLRALGCAEGGP